MRVEGKIVDIESREIFAGSVEVEQGRIVAIHRHATSAEGFIMSGFIDAHVHIESSLLTPRHFGELVARCGTVGVVSDPHEIANVLGREGIEFMIKSSKESPIRIHFTIPSSVPATEFDVAGGEISAEDIEQLARSGRFVALSEMMNVPGVLMGDDKSTQILESTKRHGLVADGHAPLLRGDDLQRYIDAGITTDHECLTLEEAKEKIQRGMKILIREGSAAKSYDILKSLIATDPESVMFCTDDAHPDDIISRGEIDHIVRCAIADGYDLFDVLKIASKSPIEHYHLDQGFLEVGARADFIVVDDLVDFRVRELYIDGECRLNNTHSCAIEQPIINNFNHDPIHIEELYRAVNDTIPVIGLIEDEIVTRAESYTPQFPTKSLESDLDNDLLKIVYLNRYCNSAPVVEYIRGFGLKEGAIASSVSHDSHNIIAVGCSDKEITSAINRVIESKGALVVVRAESVSSLELPIAGIMSAERGEKVASIYSSLQSMTKEMGSKIDSPFMTLSFMSLVVIPELKIGEKGLFDTQLFDWIK